MRILRSKVGRRVAVLAVLAIAAAAVASVSGSAHRVAVHRGVMTPDTMRAPFLAQEATPLQNPTGLVRFSCQLTVPAGCYGPDQMRAAYDTQPLLDAGYTGAGRTIVIVDAYGSSTIVSDTALFNTVWGLPQANLTVLKPFGVDPTTPDNAEGWSAETTLDVQWAHAIAPGAAIDLVIAKSNDDADILDATKYAVDNNLGDVVSQSFGEAEQCMDPAQVKRQEQIFRAAVVKGMTLFASSGDQGAGQPTCDGDHYFKAASTPASDPNVTGVGGTTLHANGVTGAYQSESTWNESDLFDDAVAGGGGLSVLYGRPLYQLAATPWRTATFMRQVPDVSYNAAVFNGVIVVWTRPGTGGPAAYRFGGTSAGSPQWAAIGAITNQLAGHRLGNINPSLYAITKINGGAYHDIADGSNNSVPDGLGGTITGFTAVPGYDMATGIGSPVSSVLAPLLAKLPAHTNPS
ncbi:MAG TPA: S53 family peptidase [Gaiellaceae bacterium]|nr:S53 family peptidase [Gaiellaceae bacterium]